MVMALCSPDDSAPLPSSPSDISGSADRLDLWRQHINTTLAAHSAYTLQSHLALQDFYASQERALALTLFPPAVVDSPAAEAIVKDEATEPLDDEPETVTDADDAAEAIAPDKDTEPQDDAEPEAVTDADDTAEAIATDETAEPQDNAEPEAVTDADDTAEAIATDQAAEPQDDAEPEAVTDADDTAEAIAPDEATEPQDDAEPEAGTDADDTAEAVATDETAEPQDDNQPEAVTDADDTAEAIAEDQAAEPVPPAERLFQQPLPLTGPLPPLADCFEQAVSLLSTGVAADAPLSRFRLRAALHGDLPAQQTNEPPVLRLDMRASASDSPDVHVFAGGITGLNGFACSCLPLTLEYSSTPSASPSAPPPEENDRPLFGQAALAALWNGDAFGFLGEGFEDMAAHRQTPRPSAQPEPSLARIDHWDPEGGPWQAGCLRAFGRTAEQAQSLSPFAVFATALDLHSIALVVCGLTRQRDGWTLAPLPQHPFTLAGSPAPLPAGDAVRYQLTLRERAARHVRADVQAWVGEREVLHLTDFALTLRPPVVKTGPESEAESGPDAIPGNAPNVHGVVQDQTALLAAACGPLAAAVGKAGDTLDRLGLRGPRLPAPPFLFLSHASMASLTPQGRGSEALFLSPSDSTRWCYQLDPIGIGDTVAMMETLYQAAGYTALWLDLPTRPPQDTCGRLLSFEMTPLHRPDLDGPPVEVSVRLAGVTRMGSTSLMETALCARQQDRVLVNARGIIGFMEAARLSQPARPIARPALSHDDSAILGPLPEGRRLPLVEGDRLPVLDRLRLADPTGGPQQLGRFVADLHNDPYHWLYAAHFHNDPVLPGSVMVASLQRLLTVAAAEKGLSLSEQSRVFDGRLSGQFRGQILPSTAQVRLCLDITTSQNGDDGSLTLKAQGRVWADGSAIGQINGLSLSGLRPTRQPASSGGDHSGA
ncbi:FabA-like domain-containing protein [Insolitispirillum peregrinum]|uniref:FabA-like domain-containing protein n=2 Tax=Insolitispirillum peregrinum TaxID=80876 RepID=A0A1N7IK00_9PROT|nr:FabA-like domain-containing protein [Insolitispirillum peregrinum]